MSIIKDSRWHEKHTKKLALKREARRLAKYYSIGGFASRATRVGDGIKFRGPAPKIEYRKAPRENFINRMFKRIAHA